MTDINVHILPCFIDFKGKTDINELFYKKIVDGLNDVEESKLKVQETCNNLRNVNSFNIKLLERYMNDLYTCKIGIDKLLGREQFCAFLRGRQLRGSTINVNNFGYRICISSVDKAQNRSPLIKNTNVESKTLRELTNIKSITFWSLEDNVSPLDDNLASFKYLYLSSPISDYKNEEEYVKRLSN